jgi:hypothetical protein
MSMSKIRTVSGPGVKADWDAGSVNSGQARRRPTRSVSATGPRGPEWKTERWRLQVEAEARNRLKKSIRDVGSER